MRKVIDFIAMIVGVIVAAVLMSILGPLFVLGFIVCAFAAAFMSGWITFQEFSAHFLKGLKKDLKNK